MARVTWVSNISKNYLVHMKDGAQTMIIEPRHGHESIRGGKTPAWQHKDPNVSRKNSRRQYYGQGSNSKSCWRQVSTTRD